MMAKSAYDRIQIEMNKRDNEIKRLKERDKDSKTANDKLIDANIKLVDENKILKTDLEFYKRDRERINNALAYIGTLGLSKDTYSNIKNILTGDVYDKEEIPEI